MKWAAFVGRVMSAQRGFLGEPDEMRPGRGDFHEFPYSCICAANYSTNSTRIKISISEEGGRKMEVNIL